jgi:epsilon-lactone hydrolase
MAAMMRIKVISVEYREAPEYKFPAASEDVARVYKELLKTDNPRNIGIYGCSAGGMLTAESMAWFQTHDLPRPGAIGIYCASAGGFGGDSSYIGPVLGEGRMPPSGTGRGRGPSQLGYFSGASQKNPLVAPINSPEMLAKFPPTLIITGTRDFAMSGALYTHEQLVKEGVDAELHVWEGLFHGFFYNADVPESRDAFQVMIQFFDRHLGRK